MRPSSISFVSVRRAISRRSPSKDESTTACGVSSMMKSTPVRCSSARMLRPSRPMMRPFMSSDGSSITVTVVSAAWLAATRCERVGDEIPRAPLRLDSRLLLEHADAACELVADELLAALEQMLPSPPGASCPAIRSSSACSASFACFSSSWSWRRCVSRSASPWSFRARSTSFRSISSSFASTRSSIFSTVSRRSASSESISARSLIACSRASIALRGEPPPPRARRRRSAGA